MTFRAFYKEGNKEFDLLIYGESCSFNPVNEENFEH